MKRQERKLKVLYMLNLIFDANDATAAQDSRFAEDDTTQPVALLRSKVWLQATIPNPCPDNPADWTLKQADTGAPIQLARQDQVWIRVLGLNTASNWVARMTTVISRDAKLATQNPNTRKPFQKRGSPFQLAANQSCVLFDFEDPIYQPISNPGGSWCQPLGPVVLTTPPPDPPPANLHDAYSVVVAITAGVGASAGQGQNSDPANVQVYSHDPDMEVEC